MIVILTILFLSISFVFKAFMDTSDKGGFKKVFLNKSNSWLDKYKNPLQPYKYIPWYYFGTIKPEYRERFPFSSTALAFLTDFWHLSQFIFLNFLFISISINIGNDFYSMVSCFLGIRLLYAILFNLFYKN